MNANDFCHSGFGPRLKSIQRALLFQDDTSRWFLDTIKCQLNVVMRPAGCAAKRSELRLETVHGSETNSDITGGRSEHCCLDIPSDRCLFLYCLLSNIFVRISRRCVVRIVEFSTVPSSQLLLESLSFMAK